MAINDLQAADDYGSVHTTVPLKGNGVPGWLIRGARFGKKIRHVVPQSTLTSARDGTRFQQTRTADGRDKVSHNASLVTLAGNTYLFILWFCGDFAAISR